MLDDDWVLNFRPRLLETHRLRRTPCPATIIHRTASLQRRRHQLSSPPSLLTQQLSFPRHHRLPSVPYPRRTNRVEPHHLTSGEKLRELPADNNNDNNQPPTPSPTPLLVGCYPSTATAHRPPRISTLHSAENSTHPARARTRRRLHHCARVCSRVIYRLVWYPQTSCSNRCSILCARRATERAVRVVSGPLGKTSPVLLFTSRGCISTPRGERPAKWSTAIQNLARK